jgi:DNA ligase (NAD+)
MYTQDELLYLKCKERYYNGQESELSDAQYDALEEKLKAEGSKVPFIVGTKKLISKDEKHEHASPMLSLEKLQVLDDNNLHAEPGFFKKLLAWLRKSDEIEYTPKFDGNAINLMYKLGQLYKGVTRGDGEKGVDKTNKLKYLVPNTISDKSPIVEIRGEALLPLSIFNEKYVVEGEVKNARNVLAGLLGTDDLEMDKILDTHFAAYSYTRTNQAGKLEFPHNTMMDLHMMGFNQNYSVKTAYMQTTGKSDEELIEEFTNIYKDFLSYRKNDSEFLLDGIVLKYKESDREKAGNTNHHPRWAISIKFETEKVKTKIIDIEWSVGTTGELNPVAILEPIELLGTVVKKASLYNLGKIVENGTWPGAEVLIRKSGEIIPQVVTVLQRSPQEELYMNQYKQMREKLI